MLLEAAFAGSSYFDVFRCGDGSFVVALGGIPTGLNERERHVATISPQAIAIKAPYGMACHYNVFSGKLLSHCFCLY